MDNTIYKVLEVAIKNNSMYLNCFIQDRNDNNLMKHAYVKLPEIQINDEDINLAIKELNEDDILIISEINDEDIEQYSQFIVKTEEEWNNIIETVDSNDLNKVVKN
jgi:hypothetical protein